jgi:hypothetical protein
MGFIRRVLRALLLHMILLKYPAWAWGGLAALRILRALFVRMIPKYPERVLGIVICQIPD